MDPSREPRQVQYRVHVHPGLLASKPIENPWDCPKTITRRM